MSISKKQKLTLSVSKDVVQRARKVGLNLSEITEKVLRGFSAIPSESDRDQVYSHYQRVLDSMLPLMVRYDIIVQIGADDDFDDQGNLISSDPFQLHTDGSIVHEMMDGTVKLVQLRDIQSYALFEPNRILSNFIDKLTNAKKQNQETIEKLQLTKRIIEVMTESVSEVTKPNRQRPGKAGAEQTSGNRARQPLVQSTKAQPLPREA